jgi:asparagine synthetase B (glutamine-hydrolysing)
VLKFLLVQALLDFMRRIFGFLGDHTRSVETSSVDLANSFTSVRHRSPDGTGKQISGNDQIGLGHVSPSLIDLAMGAQPMDREDRYYPTIDNGEVYNDIGWRLGLCIFSSLPPMVRPR